MPSFHLVIKMRRMLGPDLTPFNEILRKQPRYKQYARIAARMRVEEAKLIEHLGSVNSDPERRARLRKMVTE
jgi:hypothetical protein